MDLEFRGVIAPNGLPTQASLITPPGTTSDFRNTPRLTRPVAGFNFPNRSTELGEMEKVPPQITGKRRGGSRKACNECKQQKVS